MRDWLRLELSVPAESSDRLVAELWSLGTVGLEERTLDDRCLIRAFFPAGWALPSDCLPADGNRWSRFAASLESFETIAERDWTQLHRLRSRPFPLGRGFLVDPGEPRPGRPLNEGTRRVLRLPARRAFGIGSHESTRLLVEWLEDLDLRGLKVLDVGAGTGILSFVALAAGAESVVAVEIDPVAAFLARANQDLNETAFQLVAGGVSALEGRRRFDLALVNVLPENVASDLMRLTKLLRLGGRVLFSGILSERGERFAGTVEAAGFSIVSSRDAGDWQAWMTVLEDL